MIEIISSDANITFSSCKIVDNAAMTGTPNFYMIDSGEVYFTDSSFLNTASQNVQAIESKGG